MLSYSITKGPVRLAGEPRFVVRLQQEADHLADQLPAERDLAVQLGRALAGPLIRQEQQTHHDGERRAHAEVYVPDPGPARVKPGERDPDRE